MDGFKRNSRLMSRKNASDTRVCNEQPIVPVAMESDVGEVGVMFARLKSLVCKYSSHDWWALAYPPARRSECRRCGYLVEEAPSPVPVRRRVFRDSTKRSNRPSQS
jgi:hypothetical protein